MQREGHFRGEATQGDTNIEHTLLRNEAWIYYGRLIIGKSNVHWNIPTIEKHTIIPDAVFSKGSTPIFVEIDRTMSMKRTWKNWSITNG